MFGWVEWQDDVIFNVVSSFDVNGDLLVYYCKIQFYGVECDIFQLGVVLLLVFWFVGYCVGLLICYDIEFFQYVVGLVGCGVDLLLVLIVNLVGFGYVLQVLVFVCVYENCLMVVYVNLCGDECGLVYDGGFVVLGFDV